MARRIDPPRVDREIARRALTLTPHEVRRLRDEYNRKLATLYVVEHVADPDELVEVLDMLGLAGDTPTYLTGPVSPDAAMNSRSVR